jgi:hypothetical protein
VPEESDVGDDREPRAVGLHQLDAPAAGGLVLGRATTGRGEILVSPTEPGDKPIILRPDDRPKKQSTRMLKAECLECGYTIRLTKKWADVGLPSCPTDAAALTLDGSREHGEGPGLTIVAAAAARLT